MYSGLAPPIARSDITFLQLPDNFADAYMKAFGVPPPADVFTHCRRELYHAVIELILKGEFAEAYKHGIPIKFPDGITRRVFPRFYSYSADYPEKSVPPPTPTYQDHHSHSE